MMDRWHRSQHLDKVQATQIFRLQCRHQQIQIIHSTLPLRQLLWMQLNKLHTHQVNSVKNLHCKISFECIQKSSNSFIPFSICTHSILIMSFEVNFYGRSRLFKLNKKKYLMLLKGLASTNFHSSRSSWTYSAFSFWLDTLFFDENEDLILALISIYRTYIIFPKTWLNEFYIRMKIKVKMFPHWMMQKFIWF